MSARVLSSDVPQWQQLQNPADAPETEFKAEFHQIAALAAQLLNVPIALVSLLDANEEWTHYGVGLARIAAAGCDASAFCGYAIAEAGPLAIDDAAADPRLSQHQHVVGEAEIRFYTGIPLRHTDGRAAGTLSVMDCRPRRLSDDRLSMLTRLATLAQTTLQRNTGRRAADGAGTADEPWADMPDDTFSRAAVGILHTTPSGRILRANPSACLMLGYDEEALKAVSLCAITHADDIRHKHELSQSALRRKTDRYQTEQRLRRKEGDYLWTSLTEAVCRTPAGEPHYLIVTLEDISRRKRLENDLVERRDKLGVEIVTRNRELVEASQRLAAQTAQLSATRKALLSKGRQIKLVVDNLPSMVAYWDTEMRCQFANPQYVDWFGVASESLVGKSLHEVLGEIGFEQNEALAHAALRGETQRFERILTTTGGEVRFTEAHYIPDWQNGRVAGFVVMVADVTEQKLLELRVESERERAAAMSQELEQATALTRGVFEAAPDAILVLDRYGRVRRANAQASALFGYATSALFELSIADLLPQCRDSLEASAPDTAFLFNLNHRPAGTGAAVTGLRCDGEEFPAEVTMSPLRISDRFFFVVIVRDATERQRSQEALRNSEENFRLLVDSVTDHAIFRLDAEGYIRSWNAGAERIKGYRADEIIGRHFSCFFPPEDIALGIPDLQLQSAAREGRRLEESWRVRKNNERFWGSVMLTALRDDSGKLIGFAEVTRDLTERRHYEEQLLGTVRALEQARATLEQRIDERTADLAAARDQLEAFARSLNSNIEAERKRLARDVHDQLGQLFTGLKMSVRARAERLPEDFVLDTVTLLDEATAVARRIASELRPPLLDDLGLASALQHLAEDVVAAHGIKVLVEVNQDEYLSADQTNHLFRIVQEALTNVLRHACASQVRIDGTSDGSSYRLLVENDGKPFIEAASRGSQGLIGMRERAALIGGQMEIRAGDSGGSVVSVRFPWDPAQMLR